MKDLLKGQIPNKDYYWLMALCEFQFPEDEISQAEKEARALARVMQIVFAFRKKGLL